MRLAFDFISSVLGGMADLDDLHEPDLTHYGRVRGESNQLGAETLMLIFGAGPFSLGVQNLGAGQACIMRGHSGFIGMLSLNGCLAVGLCNLSAGNWQELGKPTTVPWEKA